jgi:hypothetical protein
MGIGQQRKKSLAHMAKRLGDLCRGSPLFLRFPLTCRNPHAEQ